MPTRRDCLREVTRFSCHGHGCFVINISIRCGEYNAGSMLEVSVDEHSHLGYRYWP